MIKVLLVDADGVLINGGKFSDHLERKYAISTNLTKEFFNGPFKDCVLGNADLKEVLIPYLKKWRWKKSVEDFLEEWFSSEHNIDKELVEYIQDLRSTGIKCYLATNQEKYRLNYILDKMGFSESFDKAYISADLGVRKPTVEFYTKVTEDLVGVSKDQILFWDDTEENVDAAKDFGIKAELYTTFENFKNKMKGYL